VDVRLSKRRTRASRAFDVDVGLGEDLSVEVRDRELTNVDHGNRSGHHHGSGMSHHHGGRLGDHTGMDHFSLD